MHQILLIEDNEGDIFLIKEAFNETNFNGKIIDIKDGESAIKYLTNLKDNNQTSDINLILLDINLPKKNGHEVLHFIKNTSGLKQIPVVMLTTSSSLIDIKLAYQNAANSFVIKSLETLDFQKKIAEINKYWFSTVQLPV